MSAMSLLTATGAAPLAATTQPVLLSSIANGEQHGITEDGIALVMTDHLYLEGNHLPHISYSRTIFMQTSGQVVRDAKVEFWLEGKTLDGKERKLIQASIVEQTLDNEKKLFLEVEYENALVAGADNLDYTWPDHFKSHIDEIQQLRGVGHCLIPLASTDEKYLDELNSKLHDYQYHTKYETFRPFFSPSQEMVTKAMEESAGALGELLKDGLRPVTTWQEMDKLHKSALSFPKVSASNTFPSLESAKIVLSNAVYLENAWEESIIEMISGGTETAFAVLSKKVVLAFVRYKDRKKLKANVALNDRMEIEVTSSIEVAVDEDGNTVSKSQEATGCYRSKKLDFTVSGMLVANRTDVESDFVLLLKKRNSSVYKAASKLETDQLLWRDSIVSVVENRSQAQKQVEAISSICQPMTYHHRFHDILLAENIAAEIPDRWLIDLVGHQSIIDRALTEVLEKSRSMGRPLNAEQETILRNVQYSYRSTDIVRGPPGCGKTTLIAAIAEFLVRMSDDIGLFLCAPSKGNTQRIHNAVRHMFSKKPTILSDSARDKAPQRVYRKHLEQEHLFHSQDLHGKNEDEEADKAWAAPFVNETDEPSSDAAWYARMADADKKREMDDPTIGITAYIIAEVLRNRSLRVMGKVDDDRCNVVPVFFQYLAKLKQRSFSKWKSKEKNSFKDAWLVLAKHFIGQKHVVCCTVGNITSGLMARALRNFKVGVIVVDEASLMTDPALWNAVVNVVSEIRYEREYDDKSPIVKLLLIGDEAQGYPLVKTEDEAFNYFGSQLARSPFERLVMAGGNVQTMWEQFRMVPALCEMPNKRWYGGKLRCSEEREQARLSAREKDLLEQYFDISYPDLITAAKDVDAAKDHYLRLLLADVPGGQCQVEPHTQSRLNMGNVDVVLKIFRDLMHKNKQGLAQGPGDVVILAFYNAQRRRLLNALLDLEKELGMSEGALDNCLHTVDSYQGREAKYVILDTTICTYFGEGSLGHAGDERKACVAATRAREVMIVVGNLKVLKANLKHEARTPFVIDLLKTLRDRGAYKTFETDAKPEKQVGAKLDSELEEEALKNGSVKEGSLDGDDAVAASEDSSVTAVEEVDPRTWDDLKAAVAALGLKDH